MPRHKTNESAALLESLLDEASWLLSHAQALADYGRAGEAHAEWARAALCEEDVACLLEADAQETEAAIHRVSAASCYQKLGANARAVTLLRAALAAAELPTDFRARAQQQHSECLAAARKALTKTRRPRKQQSAAT